MNCRLGMLLALPLLLAAAPGCTSTCDTICDYMVQCVPDMCEYAIEQVGVDASCKLHDDEDTTLDECLSECETQYDRLADGEMEKIDLCVECVDEKLGGECSGDDYIDAVDDCDSECDDDDVGDFWNEWDGDTITADCEAGGYEAECNFPGE